ncbi:MAG: hypothetical protein ER33_08950 [Cyanobium sp. CACIAM 14]|nr:MAG: hypothetical protein ER33_08950 [Cyanobium sp. CACIAM 14]
MTSKEPTFWSTIALYCRELAPISGPLLDSIGRSAAAIDRAMSQSGLGNSAMALERRPLPPESDETEWP